MPASAYLPGLILAISLSLPAFAGPLEDGQRYLKGEKWPQATQAFEQVLKSQPASRPARLGQAEARLMLSYEPVSGAADYQAEALQQLKPVEPMLASLNGMLKASPKDIDALLLRGRIQVRLAELWFLTGRIGVEEQKAFVAKGKRDYDAVIALKGRRVGEAYYLRAGLPDLPWPSIKTELTVSCSTYKYKPACEELSSEAG